jgi:hypothetical protein
LDQNGQSRRRPERLPARHDCLTFRWALPIHRQPDQRPHRRS